VIYYFHSETFPLFLFDCLREKPEGQSHEGQNGRNSRSSFLSL